MTNPVVQHPTTRDPRPGGDRRNDGPRSPVETVRDEARRELPRTRLNLPAALAERFVGLEDLPSAGLEADLMVVRSRSDERKFVAKVYRSGVHLDVDVLRRLQNADMTHVVSIIEFGQSEGLWYELLEYVEGGSLLDLLREEGPRISMQRVGTLVEELWAALSHIHELKVVHRDLKPANILARCGGGLDLVLADFGLATVIEASYEMRSGSRTVAYAAPEAAYGEVGPARDYWSFGMIVLEALTGVHPFAGLSEAVINKRLARGVVDVSAVADPRWRLLLEGLLVQDPQHRWGAEEVRRWLAGESPEVVKAPVGVAVSEQAFPFGDKECSTPEQLARELASSWRSGVRQLVGRNSFELLRAWLMTFQRPAIAALLDEFQENDDGDPEGRLARLITVLDPTLPPTFGGFDLSGDALADLAREAVAAPDSDAGGALASIFVNRILSVASAARGHSHLRQVDERWHEEFAAFVDATDSAVRAGAPAISELTQNVARARLLLAIVDEGEAAILRKDAETARTPANVRVAWFAPLAANRAGSPTPACVMATVVLADAASERAAAIQAEAERRQRERDAAARAERERKRARMRRWMYWSLVPPLLLMTGVAIERMKVPQYRYREEILGYEDLVVPMVNFAKQYGTVAVIVGALWLVFGVFLIVRSYRDRHGALDLANYALPVGSAPMMVVVGPPLLFVVGWVVAIVALIAVGIGIICALIASIGE